jgi:hypothetical protein
MNTFNTTIIAYINFESFSNFEPIIPEALKLIDPLTERKNYEDICSYDYYPEEISFSTTTEGSLNILKIEITSMVDHKIFLINQLPPLDSGIKIICEEFDPEKVTLSYYSTDHPSGLILFRTNLTYAWNNPFETDAAQYHSFFQMITPSRLTQNVLEKLEIGKRYQKQIEIEIPISFNFFL